ncbi:hypothetical protein Q6Z19_001509 [Salmonella enterica]|nr:hypothetical protein [Salmonella enterica subsp. enterica serovar Carrau]EJJ0394262.1 hypothetical protein [Salmonella enterica]EJJ4101505.1 hypothetical protein [Salmonella enterica]EJJ4234998.1 hypothetical protein [Salmonella enterica]EJJ4553920.1 hypothetical protein [Salmonella enterica]
MQTINNRMTETQIADLFSLAVQLQVKAEESDDRDTAILAYSIQNACSNLTESRREFWAADATINNLELKITDMAVQLANSESKCREMAAELSAVDKIHNEAVFITDDHYEQCPPEVQKIIRSLAVLQIPACDAFLAEVRASARNEGINYAASRLAAAFNHGFLDKPVSEVFDVTRMILSAKEELANEPHPIDGLSGEYAEKSLEEWAERLRKGGSQ